MKKNNKIIKYQRNRHINIGVILFSLLFIYLMIYMCIYFSKERVSTYEVKNGSLVNHDTYVGVAIRDETIVSADDTGYINYYVNQSARISPKSIIYTLSDDQDTYNTMAAQIDDKTFYSENNVKQLTTQMDAYCNTYNGNQFQEIYQFEDDLKANVMTLVVDQSTTTEMNNKAAKYSQQTGIISYKVDDLSGLTEDAITDDLFVCSNHQAKNLKLQTTIKSGSPIYKVITSELWQICIKPDAKFLAEVKDENYITIKFLRDDEEALVACHIKEISGTKYLVLDLNNSMVRYSDLRYIDLEIIQDETSGLKIPNSSIVSKKFNLIPLDYITLGNNDTEWGFRVQHVDEDGQVSLLFVNATLYNKDDDYYYVSNDDVAQGAIVVSEDGATTYTVQKSDTLTGVYGLNKSYVEFKLIDILHKGEVYSIIDDDTKYGISMYDHIALESSKVKEGQIIH